MELRLRALAGALALRVRIGVDRLDLHTAGRLGGERETSCHDGKIIRDICQSACLHWRSRRDQSYAYKSA